MRRRIIAGNWKMNKTIAEAVRFAKELIPLTADVDDVDVVVFPPLTAVSRVNEALQGSNIRVGAQDVFWKESGAYTGEVEPRMLIDAGCEYVILGHSERRGRFGQSDLKDEFLKVFGDNDRTVNAKAIAALRSGLKPIICCGEILDERHANQTDELIERQVLGAISGIEDIRPAIFAYEPVWAIGTGEVCEPAEANRVIGKIRSILASQFGKETAGSIRIQYGGSVNPSNIRALIDQEEIDGALVGGASLDPKSFAEVVRASSRDKSAVIH